MATWARATARTPTCLLTAAEAKLLPFPLGIWPSSSADTAWLPRVGIQSQAQWGLGARIEVSQALGWDLDWILRLAVAKTLRFTPDRDIKLIET